MSKGVWCPDWRFGVSSSGFGLWNLDFEVWGVRLLGLGGLSMGLRVWLSGFRSRDTVSVCVCVRVRGGVGVGVYLPREPCPPMTRQKGPQAWFMVYGLW